MRVDNQMMPDGTTKCWDSKGVYYVKTDPSAIRPKTQNFLFKPEGVPRDETRGKAQPPTYGSILRALDKKRGKK